MAPRAARAALARGLRWGGWALLWATAVASAALAVASLLAALPVTRPFAAATLVRMADDALAGRLELDGIGVLARGGVELRGLRVFDPAGRLVLRVERARLSADAVGLVAREVGISLELEGVDVDAALREEDGTLALAGAFAATPRPAKPARPPAAGRAAGERGDGGW
ncbi:MAG TPA: translocation/assembly module TamB, partial [Anaeromyxobacteraceae bacterium]|nr:translocation/assembly module TamB [Anaeromyxobacteraceae bacterium]